MKAVYKIKLLVVFSAASLLFGCTVMPQKVDLTAYEVNGATIGVLSTFDTTAHFSFSRTTIDRVTLYSMPHVVDNWFINEEVYSAVKDELQSVRSTLRTLDVRGYNDFRKTYVSLPLSKRSTGEVGLISGFGKKAGVDLVVYIKPAEYKNVYLGLCYGNLLKGRNYGIAYSQFDKAGCVYLFGSVKFIDVKEARLISSFPLIASQRASKQLNESEVLKIRNRYEGKLRRTALPSDKAEITEEMEHMLYKQPHHTLGEYFQLPENEALEIANILKSAIRNEVDEIFKRVRTEN